MPYTAEVSRSNPTCFLFLIDQSKSMSDVISAGDATQRKSDGVADSVNRWMQELSIKCAKSGGVGDYYHVGVVGYGKNVGPAFVGGIAGRELVPISEIAGNPGRIENRTKKIPDGSGGLIDQAVKVPVWFDPTADGGTPMCRAAAEGYRILQDWVTGHPESYPPIVIHITDGEATDGDPTPRIQGMANLSTSDGEVMLFNIHLSANPHATPVIFPDSPDNLPDAYSRMLFETASPLTPVMRALAKEHGIATSENSRAFVLNADMVLLVQAIDIGTRPANFKPATSDSMVVEDLEPEPEPESPGVLSEEPLFDDDPVPGNEEVTPEPNADDQAMREAELREEAMVAERAAAQEAAAAPAAAPAATPTVTTGVAVAGAPPFRLTCQTTGQVVEAEIHTDDAGRVINIVPIVPLEPGNEYHLGPQA